MRCIRSSMRRSRRLCWRRLVAAQRPADREHPYGHGRLEAVAGAGVAVVLLALAVAITYESLSTIAMPEPPRRPASPSSLPEAVRSFRSCFIVMPAGWPAARVPRPLLATAWDYRLDAMSGIGVLIGVALAKWTGWHWADHVAAVLVAITVLWIGGWASVGKRAITRSTARPSPSFLRKSGAEARVVPESAGGGRSYVCGGWGSSISQKSTCRLMAVNP